MHNKRDNEIDKEMEFILGLGTHEQMVLTVCGYALAAHALKAATLARDRRPGPVSPSPAVDNSYRQAQTLYDTSASRVSSLSHHYVQNRSFGEATALANAVHLGKRFPCHFAICPCH
jgi:hypothetical protein